MNKYRTCALADTRLTQLRSLPVLSAVLSSHIRQSASSRSGSAGIVAQAAEYPARRKPNVALSAHQRPEVEPTQLASGRAFQSFREIRPASYRLAVHEFDRNFKGLGHLAKGQIFRIFIIQKCPREVVQGRRQHAIDLMEVHGHGFFESIPHGEVGLLGVFIAVAVPQGNDVASEGERFLICDIHISTLDLGNGDRSGLAKTKTHVLRMIFGRGNVSSRVLKHAAICQSRQDLVGMRHSRDPGQHLFRGFSHRSLQSRAKSPLRCIPYRAIGPVCQGALACTF